MSFLSSIKNQLRSVIEWNNPKEGTLFYKWSGNGDEIKNASKLIVGPGQGCIFVCEGKVHSILEQEIMIDLETSNIPFWTTITKFMQAFESEHKVGIYFFKRTKIVDQKWGTSNEVKYEDPKYKFPVGLRAYGNYSFKISDPELFFKSVLGAQDYYSINDFRQVMTNRLTQPLSNLLAEAKFSYAEIDSKREEISNEIISKVANDFLKLGFEITDFRVEGTSFDEDTMNRINRIADITAEAQAANAAGLTYAQVQQLDALKDAAKNEGGAAGAGMTIGAGLTFGQMMGNNITQSQQNNDNQDDHVATLEKLKKMLDAKLINETDYETKKKEVLARM